MSHIEIIKYSFNLRIFPSFLILILTFLSTGSGPSCKSDTIPPLVTPVYPKLKNMSIPIPLVKDGRPACAIVTPDIYKVSASAIRETIERLAGVKVPVISDSDPGAAAPFKNNLIILGNRSTSKISCELYDRFYSLMDLRYPGPKGYSVRSLHDPYANGYSAVLVGGSDPEGVAAGSQAFCDHLEKLKNLDKKTFSVGWTMLTKLGEGVVIPTNINEFEIWEASARYGSVGYFGWNSISKRMAMYYMTGDSFNAREVMRLSFPDAQALKEIDAVDGERIENKKDPLAGPYHYNSMMLILFWDLIEESPEFTDAERLKVTNAFARRFEHEGTTPFDKNIYKMNAVPEMVGSRHHQYSGLSVLTLARYFNKYYPGPMWAHAEKAGKLVFAPLQSHTYIETFGDPSSYSTGLEPILTYMLLTGDYKPLENGVLSELLKGYEILMNGTPKESALNAASLDFLNKTAYITGDGRWITYLNRTGLNTSVFRLGQSFWPEDRIKPADPNDLEGKWTLKQMPEGMWKDRNNHFTLKQSFENISYRNTPDSTGDYVLLKGFNAAYSNPYHTLAIMELRLNGATLLRGYNNQVLSSADGMVEPEVPMDAALLYSDVTGEVAAAVAKVPLPFTDWQRSLVQRTGKYVLLADELHFRNKPGDQAEIVANIETQWDMPKAEWFPREQYFRIFPGNGDPKTAYELHSSEIMDIKKGEAFSMNWNSPVKNGQKMTIFHLLGLKKNGSAEQISNIGLTTNAASLLLPGAAVVATGSYENLQGDLVLISENNMYGHNIIKAGFGSKIFEASTPVDLDWNFAGGNISIVINAGARIKIAVIHPGINLDGKLIRGMRDGSLYSFDIPAGRHIITGANLPDADRRSLSVRLKSVHRQAREKRAQAMSSVNKNIPVAVPGLKIVMQARTGSSPVEGITIPSVNGDILCTASGKNITLFDAEGKTVMKLSAGGNVRVLNWWKEYRLLLAGCDNEEVVAFDENGNKKWTFTSIMDPAVYEAGKPYWFKSRDPGIYGLYNGEFDNGRSRAFAGSACTLEILDENGQLVKRTPVFWGPGRQFLLVNAPDGSKNLLVGRWRNGYNTLSVINSKEMKEVGRSYNSVPPGHTFIDGWTSMNRYDNFVTDLEGDGKKEVVSAINGTWNRVTVYSETGAPLYNAQFGPGTKDPRSNIRMMDIADLNGDGKQEIVTGLSSGFVDVLDTKAEKLWAKLLPSAPVVVKIVNQPGSVWICAGCEDGSVFAIDGKGNIMKTAKVRGRPVDLQIMNTRNGKIAVITTESGEIKGFSSPFQPG